MQKSESPVKRPLRGVYLRLYAEDVDDAKAIYAATGYNKIVRKLFAVHMDQIRKLYKKELANDARLRNIDPDSVDSPGGSASGGGADPDPGGTL